MPANNQSFLVHKKDWGQTQWVDHPMPEIGPGEILLRIDKYCFSSNNITYAVIGEKVGYWQYYPVEAPFGRIPVWGFAEVLESKQEEIKVGERYFGFLPMSRFVKMSIGKNSPAGFSENSEHRIQLPAIYNNYSRIPDDKSLAEDFSLLNRILFPTSFLVYHFLKEAHFFGAEQLILTSASSKTALGLAFLLQKNRAADGNKIIGLTSPRNVDFVKNTGFYDEVLPYSDLEKELTQRASTIIDFAGNSKLLSHLNDFLQEQLKYISLIGITNWSADKAFTSLANAQIFNTADQVKGIFKKLGPQQAGEVIQKELANYSAAVSTFLSLTYVKETSALADLYQDMLKGKMDPSKGYIVQL